MRLVLLVIFLFAVGYGSMWAILHYCVNMDSWSNCLRIFVSTIVPVTTGAMCVVGSPELNKIL